MAESKIEWCTKVWNVTRGCRRVSPGCGGAHNEGGCYAERQAMRMSNPGGAYEGLVHLTARGPRWTGKGLFVAEKLSEPLKWRKPERVFVDSMSDLFFEAFSFEEIAAVFGVMAACPHHTFQVLTKRPKRALEFFAYLDSIVRDILAKVPGNRPPEDWYLSQTLGVAEDMLGLRLSPADEGEFMGIPWPLPNVHLGVSTEDQKTADERIPLLRQCPAAVRFLSIEPLLEQVRLPDGFNGESQSIHMCASVEGMLAGRHFSHLLDDDRRPLSRPAAKKQLEELRQSGVKVIRIGKCDNFDDQKGCLGHEHRHPISWVIIGGESGPGARPCNVDWIRSIVRQCRTAGVACFVKQLGALPVVGNHWEWLHTDTEDSQRFKLLQTDPKLWRVVLKDKKGGALEEWPRDLRVREFPDVH